MRRVLAVFFAAVLPGYLPCSARAQQPVLLPAAASSESVAIGPGDLIHVTVFREPDLEEHVRVKDSGSVQLPLIGDVSIARLSVSQAADRIAALYRAGHFLNDPQVSVFIEESVTQNAAVLGQVQHPGLVPLTSAHGLLEVISQAGGLTNIADRHVTIHHPGAPPETVFLSNQADAAIEQADVPVRPGDTIVVPRAGIVYVLGDVARPGGFVMQDESRMSLLQALSMAAGANKTAKENGARLLRRVNGAMVEQPLQLKAIERGQQPDFELQPEDIIFVPFSLARNLAVGSTAIVASAAGAAIYALP